MNFKYKKLTACILMALQLHPLTALAAATDLSNSPLTNAGSTVVRPNIMMLFDTSGSMAWDYTPDYVNDNNTCWGGADGGVTQPAIACGYGDTGFNSPDFNSQSYNPDIRYKPGIKADGTDKTSYDAANSANWTAVPNDAYGKMAAGTTNLASGVKDRIWCISQNATDDSKTTKNNCRVNEGSSSYPEVVGQNGPGVDTFSYGKDTSNNIRYRTGSPYYYTISPTEYCSDANLTTCKTLNSPGTGADSAYIYPAKLRFCTTSARTTCQGKYQDTGTTYKYPKWVGVYKAAVSGVTGASSSATLTINGITGNTSGAQISSFKLNGYEFGPLNVASTNTTSVATDIATIVNAQSGTTGFTASSSGNVITYTATSQTSTLNNKAFSATSSTIIETYPVYQIKINSVVNGSNKLNKSGSSINGTNLLSSNINVAYGANNLANRIAFCGVIKSGIDSTSKFSTNSCTNDGTSAYLKFSPTSTLLGTNPTIANWNTSPSLSTSGVSLTSSLPTSGVVKQVSFKANGGTAGTSVSGTTSGGATPVAGSNPARTGAGQFNKVFIDSSVNSYPKGISRDDCVGTTCTYAEEMTNYANWHAYYKTRNQSMKSAVGRSFSTLGDNYRVGLIDLSAGWGGSTLTSSSNFMPVGAFTPNSTQRTNWYTKLYNLPASTNTPLRESLYGVGEYYKGSTTATDPIEYSCQQNYVFLATDGYWNGNTSWSTIGNQDNANSGYSTRASGSYDGALTNSSSTLADVAMYYYKNDLRTTGALATNNVPTTSKDTNSAQHMVTFTMGLGVDGLVKYDSNYETALTGDFAKIVNGDAGCTWESSQANTCNWPVPVHDTQSAVDDLWHAAVNGRGKYYSAKNPQEAANGLDDALTQIQQVTGAAAASATSSPNITPTDNSIFSSTYQTVVWDGEIMKQRIDPSTGTILAFDANNDWLASAKVNAQADSLAGGNSAGRTLYTFDLTASGYDKKKNFDYASLTVAEKALFSGKCSTSGGYSQCSTMNANRKAQADNSQNLINFLRGYNTANEFDDSGIPYGYLDIFRSNRTNRLGDTVNATPTYVHLPSYTFNYTTTGQLYGDFKTANATRDGVLYIAANDGYLHAFQGSSGNELWAYTPRTLMSNLYKLADQSYGSNHQYYVDGSPVTMDVFDDSSLTWKTILVGGYNHGGQGFYALDITSPTNPKALWEICNNSSNCKATTTILDLGYSYGNPIITRMPVGSSFAGKWVVLLTSGYNNATGNGKVFVIDAITGDKLDTYSTTVGTPTNPSGLAKLSTAAPNFYYDGYSTVAYAGDLFGNIWRFDLTLDGSNANAIKLIGTAKDPGGIPQPITSRIEIGSVPNTTDKPVLFIGTGEYLGVTDLSNTQVQSLYAIKDPYTPGDTNVAYSDLRAAGIIEHTISDISSVRTISTEPVNWTSNAGWRVDLPDSGERITLDPQLTLGTLTVSANVINPSISNACSVGGYSYLYQFDYKTGTYISTATNQAVGKKNANALLVGNVIVKLPSGVMKIITTTATGAKSVDALFTSGNSASGSRISWREITL